MGNLIIYPKSHLSGSLPIKENDTKNSKHQNDGLVKFESVMENMSTFDQFKIKVKVGSAVIMHSNLIHRSIDNNSEKNRNSLLLTYIKDKCNFREGFEAKRKKIPLHN
jgi:ectoine hydroxylase-related dioxygenase (phytanoyl-CoA dioxygenase family)